MGSLFAGIGGFDLGFERAGWKTKWQVEINPIHRLVLADNFSGAKQFSDIRECGPHNLEKVECITAGFPCQDFSTMGGSGKKERQGLKGERSGLFWEALRIIRQIQPKWVVFENVPGLLDFNDGKDFQTIIRALADSGYLGYWRMLNAQYFGVPQKRRRLFLVAGLGRHPSMEFLVDAAPMEAIPVTFGKITIPRAQVSFASNTLTAKNTSSRINLGAEVLIAEENGWNQMVERERKSRLYGVPSGLDDENHYQNYAAGNAICPHIAEWLAKFLI